MPLSTVTRLESPAGLTVELFENGAVRRMDHGGTIINLFIGNELEGSVANLYLRRLNPDTVQYVELLGPRSPTRFRLTDDGWTGSGDWAGIHYTVQLRLATASPAWFWQVSLENTESTPQHADVIYVQDVALSTYGRVRLNELYVSQYVDHTPLLHSKNGHVVACRQNLAVAGSHPWCVIGSLRRAAAFATDGLQVHGLAARAGEPPAGLVQGLPTRRLQHEHSMAAIQDEPLHLATGERADTGFFGGFRPDHSEATSLIDLNAIDQILALPEAVLTDIDAVADQAPGSATLFSHAPLLKALDLQFDELESLFATQRQHEELDEHGSVLSFFYEEDRHVVLRAKQRRVLRPHGHLLRSGRHVTPDERALTSTVWMNGVFHSMFTQGHVSFNRLLSTVHSYLGLFRSHGLRLFVELNGQWQLLDLPSAYEMRLDACRWFYKHADGMIEVRSEAHAEHRMSLHVLCDSPVRLLITCHVALNGDDGSVSGAACWRQAGNEIVIQPAQDSELALKFPQGSFVITPHAPAGIERIGGDEQLFLDGRSRQQPFVCMVVTATMSFGLDIRGNLITESIDVPDASDGPLVELQGIEAPPESPLAAQVERLVGILPWFRHNALVHYLSPRGLEQYSGGGWGTRDVTQGPVEMLLALGHFSPIRDLLLRVMGAQTPDGDWPQWFTFFDREREIRAGDSHGDIVFWPLLALSQYLLASGDRSILDEPVPFFSSERVLPAVSVWKHVERALKVIERRVVAGTALAAYGHGDWNDALQPVDPAMRERLCSAWTVTLHFRVLTSLAQAMRSIGHEQEAARFENWAANVKRDFQHVLLVDGVLAGYALFEERGKESYLLHPRDGVTGVRYSSLAMIHAILEGLFSPEQARRHLRSIDLHLSGPDGVRLFDRPMSYHGGPQRFFQRAESATFFGREIGLMYMHAHLRYAQALAKIGETEQFFRALCQANPIGIRSLVPSATLRQANCYYSSSDAAFEDRYQASAEYERVARGTVPLDGGWRVYSSGAGIAVGLIVRRFLGLSIEARDITLDPVIPPALNGLCVRLSLFGKPVLLKYEVSGEGWGVSAVSVNGHDVPLTHDANPYRKGAARLQRAFLVARLDQPHNTLRIKVG